MVKNTIGGKKGKMMAKKNFGKGGDVGGGGNLRLSENEHEMYVCVTKNFGGGIFCVVNNDGMEFKAILRGKMKGFNKRHNMVSLFSILLVGKRIDLSDSNNCDVLFVYEHSHIPFLSLLPNIRIHHLISIHNNQQSFDHKKKIDVDVEIEHDDLFIYKEPEHNTIFTYEQNVTENKNDIDIDIDIFDI
jgi:hypothetical protein